MPPRERMGRILEISLPSEELKINIKEAAKARGCSVSQLIRSFFEELDRPPRPNNRQDLEILREDNRMLAGQLNEAKLRIAALEVENRQLRAAPFLQASGEAEINLDLLKVIRAGAIHDHKLLETLQIDPASQEVRAISAQLHALEVLGMIRRSSHGWIWQG